MPNTTILIVFCVIIIVFFVLREFWCWYWKLSRMSESLENIDKKLEMLLKVIVDDSYKDQLKLDNSQSENSKRLNMPNRDLPDKSWICGDCGTINKQGVLNCEKCGKYWI